MTHRLPLEITVEPVCSVHIEDNYIGDMRSILMNLDKLEVANHKLDKTRFSLFTPLLLLFSQLDC